MKKDLCALENKPQRKANAFNRMYHKIQQWTVGLCAAVFTVFAAAMPVGAVNINDKMTTETMIEGIIDFVISVAKWMGFVVVAMGVFMFIMAYKDDNAEQQSKAARFAIVGALLIGLESILKLTGLVQ